VRKVRLAINVSLDGYVVRPNGTLDWVFRTITPAQQAWTTAFLREVDTILIGHTTYLEQAAFWPTQTGEMATLMNSHAKIVFSSRLPTLEWEPFPTGFSRGGPRDRATETRAWPRHLRDRGRTAFSVPFAKRAHRRVQPDDSSDSPGERQCRSLGRSLRSSR